jgi:hypothetical protein
MDKQKKDELFKNHREAYQQKKSQLAGNTQEAPSTLSQFSMSIVKCALYSNVYHLLV